MYLMSFRLYPTHYSFVKPCAVQVFTSIDSEDREEAALNNHAICASAGGRLDVVPSREGSRTGFVVSSWCLSPKPVEVAATAL